jgi:hypothetical protein
MRIPAMVSLLVGACQCQSLPNGKGIKCEQLPAYLMSLGTQPFDSIEATASRPFPSFLASTPPPPPPPQPSFGVLNQKKFEVG